MLLLLEKCDVKASLLCVFIVIACSFIVFYMFFYCPTRINVAIYYPFSMVLLSTHCFLLELLQVSPSNMQVG